MVTLVSKWINSCTCFLQFVVKIRCAIERLSLTSWTDADVLFQNSRIFKDRRWEKFVHPLTLFKTLLFFQSILFSLFFIYFFLFLIIFTVARFFIFVYISILRLHEELDLSLVSLEFRLKSPLPPASTAYFSKSQFKRALNEKNPLYSKNYSLVERND